MKKTLIVITGPTAVGKTRLSLTLAGRLGVPIINADSRQIYRDMVIGTAAPTEEEQRRVRHYFVGTLALDEYYSASMYEQQVMELLPRLFAASDYALMSGGSMMYIDAVCNGIDDIPTVDDETRATMKRRLAEEGLESLCEELRRLDPEHWAIVDRKNPRRVVHALEICHMTGRTYTSFRKKEAKWGKEQGEGRLSDEYSISPNGSDCQSERLGLGVRTVRTDSGLRDGIDSQRFFRIVKIGLTLPREEIYDRINRRVDMMMEQGLLDEARRLLPMRHLNALNTVGYKEMFAHLDGTWTLDEAVERMKGNTRRYARKQLTWFKRDPSVAWFAPDDVDAVMEHISNKLYN